MRGHDVNKNVTIVEINIFERMLPLVSGYLQAYACADPEIAKTYRFTQYTTTTRTPFGQLVSDLAAQDSDVYAFSCYLWNMGLMKSLLAALVKMNPEAHFLLGGPQVMRHAHNYLHPSHESLMLCNGEGERTFTNVLRELTCSRPDFSSVNGLSFYRDGTLITTDAETRILSLDEIPSPFLTGVFHDPYRMAVMETNRGCPFRCNFCYWGAATNDRVYKFGEDRIQEEMSWLSRHGVPLLYLADANWGMLHRDIALAEHIAKCKKERGVPFYVYFAAAKNSPSRVAEIAKVFSEAGMLNTQPISMQSLDEATLDYIDRKNIKLSAYESLQEDLNDKGISSYIELIWPLPGETLASFKNGIENLCTLGAAHIIAYPHMLLHNTPLYERKDEFQLVTRTVSDSVAEAELVIQTAEVDYEDFKQGLRFFYAVLALYNAHVLRRLTAYLHENAIMSYADLFTAFVDTLRRDEHDPFGKFCETSIDEAHFYDVKNYPTVYHIVLHAERKAFEALLYRFASSQAFWDDERARFLFELDMFANPYVYSNTPVELPAFPLQCIEPLDASHRAYVIAIPEQWASLAEELGGGGAADVDGRILVRLDHKRGQQPYRAERSPEENASYCSGAIMRIADIAPAWSRISGTEREHDGGRE